MKNILDKIRDFAVKHKMSSAVILIVIIAIVYQIAKSSGTTVQTTYTFGTASRGTIVSTVSGTGQVSAVDQIDLKTQTAGKLTYLNAVLGQTVQARELLAQIDTTDAAYALEDAKLAYDKLITVDPATWQKNKNTVAQAQTALGNSYVSARTSLNSALTNMTDISTGLTALFDFNTGFLTAGNYSQDGTGKQYQAKAEDSEYTFDNSLNDLTIRYRNISASSSDAEIEQKVADFYQTAELALQATKDAQDAVIYLKNNSIDTKNQTQASNAYSSVINLVSTGNVVVSNLSSVQNSINNSKISLQNATTDLNTLTSGPDTLALRQAQLTVNQAQTTLDNCSVIAPFAGVIAAVPVNKGDTLSNGATVVTLITKQELAKISLNEIDAAKVVVGQKATVTFDAISDLTITGKVTSVDLIGTVSQGVVSYNVQITFDVNDDRVKPGMSVSAVIITEVKTDILTVPNGAVKSQGNANYVQIPGVSSSSVPVNQVVTIGVSNDTLTEILSGLKEGDTVITKTVTGTTVVKTTSPASISSLLGGNRGGRVGN